MINGRIYIGHYLVAAAAAVASSARVLSICRHSGPPQPPLSLFPPPSLSPIGDECVRFLIFNLVTLFSGSVLTWLSSAHAANYRCQCQLKAINFTPSSFCFLTHLGQLSLGRGVAGGRGWAPRDLHLPIGFRC